MEKIWLCPRKKITLTSTGSVEAIDPVNQVVYVCSYSEMGWYRSKRMPDTLPVTMNVETCSNRFNGPTSDSSAIGSSSASSTREFGELYLLFKEYATSQEIQEFRKWHGSMNVLDSGSELKWRRELSPEESDLHSVWLEESRGRQFNTEKFRELDTSHKSSQKFRVSKNSQFSIEFLGSKVHFIADGRVHWELNTKTRLARSSRQLIVAKRVYNS